MVRDARTDCIKVVIRIKQLHACDVVFTLFLAEMWEVGYARCGCMRSLPVKVVAEADLGIFFVNFSRMKILEAFN